MAITTQDSIERMLAEQDDGAGLVKPESNALEAITRSEVAMQLDAAHRYPRSVTRFYKEAKSLVTANEEIAAACFYSIPRDGKMVTGPSIRLAEIAASSWGNMHVGARCIDENDREVTAQGVAWDLQTNLRVTVEVGRGILTKNGRTFSDSMIQTTKLAAISIALRNAVFRVIPRAYINALEQAARACAVGDEKTLVERRDASLAHFSKMGLTPERVFARLGIDGPADFTLEHLSTLIGLNTALKQGDTTLDEAFPSVAPAPVPEGTPEGTRVKLPGKKTPSNDTKAGQ